MTVFLIILLIAIVAGFGFSIYDAKVLRPVFEAQKNKTKQLMREILPEVKIHAIYSPHEVHITYLDSEYLVVGPNYKSKEDGGPNTSVAGFGPDRRARIFWQRFHQDTKELNAQHFREALEFVKTQTPNQSITAQRASRVADC